MIYKKIFREIIDRCKRLYISDYEFRTILNDIANDSDVPITFLKYEIQNGSNDFMFIGDSLGRSESDRSASFSFGMSDAKYIINVEVYLSYSSATGNFDRNEFESLLEELLIAFWKPTIRSEKSKMVTINEQIAQNTISEIKNEELSFVFCDLDNFGQVNKAYGHSAGDQIIEEFGNQITKNLEDKSIGIHHSGDEFIVISPYCDPKCIIGNLFSLGASLSEYFHSTPTLGHAVEDVDNPPVLTGSFGVAVCSYEYGSKSFEQLKLDSNKALIEKAKQSGKNCARFYGAVEPDFCEATDKNLKKALLLVVSNYDQSYVFENPWLQTLSSISYLACNSEDGFGSDVDNFLEWVKPHFKPGISFINKINSRLYDPVMSYADCAFACLHGVYVALSKNDEYLNKQISIVISNHGFGINVDDSTLMVVGNIDDGLIFECGLIHPYCSNASASQFVLLKIGYDDHLVDDICFSDIVVVDDRPTIGGGLPDFWQINIIRLLTKLINNKNIDTIITYGDVKNATLTIKCLMSLDSILHDKDHIVYKVGLKSKDIENAVANVAGKIYHANDENDLVCTMYDQLFNVRNYIDLKSVSSPGPTQFLERVVDYENYELQSEDGVRVDTVSEAFPIILDIVRNHKGLKELKDQAEQSFIELTDFKVVLRNPTFDVIPFFYANEQDSLDRYFTNQFITKGGLFHDALNKHNQLECVVGHVASLVSSGEMISTRRAILVVPHDTVVNADLSPLGLVSIRIIPVYTQKKVTLNFSYTWRTVESFVGFPFSIYAAVKYSQFLLGEIASNAGVNVGSQINIGTITYIAHSLHMFNDVHSQNIAKKIVDDATL